MRQCYMLYGIEIFYKRGCLAPWFNYQLVAQYIYV